MFSVKLIVFVTNKMIISRKKIIKLIIKKWNILYLDITLKLIYFILKHLPTKNKLLLNYLKKYNIIIEIINNTLNPLKYHEKLYNV